ncbi:hypothetical protein KY55_08850 [Clostridium tetani]|nr:hypothetical protein KY55_08850 [Clostridium tetani]RXI72199.1 hypothetical protein DP127_08045 [Clostridium tetani]
MFTPLRGRKIIIFLLLDLDKDVNLIELHKIHHNNMKYHKNPHEIHGGFINLPYLILNVHIYIF